MSLKLTLAALALGLAAATDCCTYDQPDGPTAEKGCSCSTEPMAGCFKTGEEPFSFPNPGPEGGYRPKVPEAQCDPAFHFQQFPFGEEYVCEKNMVEGVVVPFTADGIDTFCCGGMKFDCTGLTGPDRLECFKGCAFNWCPGNGAASGFDRVPDPENPAKTICEPAEPEFPCDDPNLVCPVGDASGCPGDLPVCCPTSSGGRRRRLNFYPTTGCCQETCD